MKLKIFTCFMVGYFIMSLSFTNNIGAQGTGDSPATVEDKKTIQQKQAYNEEKRKIQQYANQQKKLERNKNKYNDATPYYVPSWEEHSIKYNTINVPSFEQETGYYCGPATVKQVVHYFNGSSGSQDYYATKLGTSDPQGTVFSYVDNVLNDHIEGSDYYVSKIGSLENWFNTIKYNIDKGEPVILDLEIYPHYMPKYKYYVEGHILNVSGYDIRDSSSEQLRLTDPYDQRNRGLTIGNVWHPLNGVYDANDDHFRKEFIH